MQNSQIYPSIFYKGNKTKKYSNMVVQSSRSVHIYQDTDQFGLLPNINPYPTVPSVTQWPSSLGTARLAINKSRVRIEDEHPPTLSREARSTLLILPLTSCQEISLPCFETVGWATGRASGV